MFALPCRYNYLTKMLQSTFVGEQKIDIFQKQNVNPKIKESAPIIASCN